MTVWNSRSTIDSSRFQVLRALFLAIPGGHEGTGFRGERARFVFDNVPPRAALLGAHRLMHRALRLRLAERLVVLTSLARLGFWRRYRAAQNSATASVAKRGESAGGNGDHSAGAEEAR